MLKKELGFKQAEMDFISGFKKKKFNISFLLFKKIFFASFL